MCRIILHSSLSLSIQHTVQDSISQSHVHPTHFAGFYTPVPHPPNTQCRIPYPSPTSIDSIPQSQVHLRKEVNKEPLNINPHVSPLCCFHIHHHTVGGYIYICNAHVQSQAYNQGLQSSEWFDIKGGRGRERDGLVWDELEGLDVGKVVLKLLKSWKLDRHWISRTFYMEEREREREKSSNWSRE